MSCIDIKKNIISDEDPLIDNQLWSIDRLAQYIDVSISTIRDWVYKRKIPFVKLGRHIRFKPSDISDWIQKRRK